ncbi:ATP-binding protein [Streptomyces albus]|uniref:ATP-binding protein n=1 Tax=Streptomyces albus TaxID=1888 RepID=UPI00345715D5
MVTTRALLTARGNIGDTVAARVMMGRRLGKTLAVNTRLRALEPGEDVRKITFRARPTARAVRYELFTALDLVGELPRHPSEFDRLLKTALAERPRTFLVDKAQWLNGEAFEYFRYLWDEPSTRLAIMFVGGEGCHAVLRREPMLSSRVFIRQHFTRLNPDEVPDVISLFHPVWADANPEDITFANSHAAHGNFRTWAQLTAHTRTALERTGRPRADQELLLSLQPPRLTTTPPCFSPRGRRPSSWSPTAMTTRPTPTPPWPSTIRRQAGAPCTSARAGHGPRSGRVRCDTKIEQAI